MRIVLIGPGDIEYHYQKLLGISKKKLEVELDDIAKSLVDSDCEIDILPDKGISFEIAKRYKEMGGKKVVASLPKSDKTFGVKHLEEFVGKIDFDEVIDTGDWFKHDLIKGLLGDAILYLGSSPGTNGELNYAIYLYKLLSGRKEGIEIAGKYIHPSIRAGIDFKIFVYSPFLKNSKLDPELEDYIRKFGIELIYVSGFNDLRMNLKSGK